MTSVVFPGYFNVFCIEAYYAWDHWTQEVQFLEVDGFV